MFSSGENIVYIADRLAQIAADAATLVGSYLRTAARSKPAFSNKSSIHDPVTQYDRNCEQMMLDFLFTQVPGSWVLAEEEGERKLGTNYPKRGRIADEISSLGERVCWIIDPIDGTANFASGLTYFGSSIAAELDGKVVAGAISIPCSYDLFVANYREAFHIDRHGNRTKLDASGATSQDKAILSTYYPSRLDLVRYPDRSIEHMGVLHNTYFVTRILGAGALDLALVAAGWLGVMIGTSFRPWDLAAGVHLLRNAGGVVINYNKVSNKAKPGTDLPFGQRPIICAHNASFNATTVKRILHESLGIAN